MITLDLSYEETIRRITQREEEYAKKGLKRSLWREVTYPYDVDLYKGENQIIVVPTITTTGGFSVAMAWHRQITDLENAELIGITILEALEHIKKSPVDARTEKEREDDSIWKNASTYKSYKSFNKNYILCGVILDKDGKITISPTEKLDDNKGYGGNDEGCVYLNINDSPEEIGNAVINCFKMMEEAEENKKTGKKKRTSVIETLSDDKISFELPDLNRYEDEQDFHSAEIYQGYSFSYHNADEPAARFYFSIAPELDNELNKDTVLNAFEEEYEETSDITYKELTDNFYECYADIISDNYRKIAYIRRMDEDELFSCELIIETKSLRTATLIKLIRDFDNMANSCKFV